jgi:pimeloyl-ACP methyl ester carboxylesterase
MGSFTWDQRNSGLAKGALDTSRLTIEQYVDDTDAVVDAVRSRYGNPEIFLYGASWGGTLGIASLIDSDRQRKITAFIDHTSGHNQPLALRISSERVIEHAKRHSEEEVWQKALAWYETQPTIGIDNILHHARFVRRMGGYGKRGFPREALLVGVKMAVKSPLGVVRMLQNSENVKENFDVWGVNLTPYMQQITLPMLIVWGRDDVILPFELAEHAYKAIGTPGADKSILQLRGSAHSVDDVERQVLFESIVGFIEKYRQIDVTSGPWS